MQRFLSALAIALATALPLRAETPNWAEELYGALGFTDLMQIVREEGVGYGARIEADLFPGKGGDAWSASVETAYDTEWMRGQVLKGMAEMLTADQAQAILAFFRSETGLRVVEFEIAARRSLLDPEVEEAASESWQALQEEDGPRWRLLTDFAQTNDLIESNIAGAMNSNYAFYMGLIEGSAFEQPLPEREVLADVWSQEPQIRDDTFDFVYSFGVLAYEPLTDDEFAAYIAFSATPEGQALNATIFSVFDRMFSAISRDLGLAAARHLAGEDI
jgi:hypothetical protein